MDTAGMLHRRGASLGAERVSHGCSTVTPGDVCARGKGGSCCWCVCAQGNESGEVTELQLV